EQGAQAAPLQLTQLVGGEELGAVELALPGQLAQLAAAPQGQGGEDVADDGGIEGHADAPESLEKAEELTTESQRAQRKTRTASSAFSVSSVTLWLVLCVRHATSASSRHDGVGPVGRASVRSMNSRCQVSYTSRLYRNQFGLLRLRRSACASMKSCSTRRSSIGASCPPDESHSKIGCPKPS